MDKDPTDEPKLDRLFENLVREGWLLDMNAGVDPTLTRMDAETGVFNQAYFQALTQEAVIDREQGRGPRPGDGPEQGAIAMVSVRLTDIEGIEWSIGKGGVAELLEQVARRLETVLRAEDLVGRTREDTFSLLLRGCPPDMLENISGRCVGAVEREPFEIRGKRIEPRVVAGVAQWTDGGAAEILHASWAAIGIA